MWKKIPFAETLCRKACREPMQEGTQTLKPWYIMPFIVMCNDITWPVLGEQSVTDACIMSDPMDGKTCQIFRSSKALQLPQGCVCTQRNIQAAALVIDRGQGAGIGLTTWQGGASHQNCM